MDVFIPTEELHFSAVPAPNDDFHASLEPFCLTYDGYASGKRSIDDCFEVAERCERSGFESASLDDLRTAAFIWQRKIRADEMDSGVLDPMLVRKIRAAIDEIGNRLRRKESSMR